MPNGKPFTQSEIDLLHNESLSHSDIAELTGRSVSTVCIKRKSLGITKYKRATVKYTPEQLQYVEDLSLTDAKVGRLIGKSNKAVHSKRRAMGLIN